ncbi:MAG: tannase/feruloyl esterase family alpha/beta hydrolase [Alphaproteobacteria bacterium]|nr:tannase/feruloyl esterase family alpha/beta hydrolase [Alphaproteobacteria bacterium]
MISFTSNTAYPKLAGFITLVLAAILSEPTHAEISSAACIAFGDTNFTIGDGTPGEVKKGRVIEATNDTPAYCELSGFVAPQVGFEIRLPLEGWNGRFLQQGCSGMCGKLVLDAANDALARGYATATTDMGHRAVSSRSGIWAYDDPSAKIDYWYRGTHVVALAAQQLVAEFYGRALDRAFYRGCGTGGRAGLIEAQRYPNDFDGVLITGGSVLNFVRNNYSIMWGIKSNLDQNGEPILSAEDLELVHAAVQQECATDGTGVIANPLTCAFDPGSLACAADSSRQCLSPEKVSTVRRYYDGPVNSAGEQLYSGQSKGSELGWSRGFFGNPSVMGKYIIEHYRYLLYPEAPGPTFELSQVDFEEPLETFSGVDVQSAADRVDYDGFKERDGKLLMTYGWNESSMPGSFAAQYFDRVANANAGVSATQEFFRLFMVPGTFSCRGGSPSGQQIDLLSAMEKWVEEGTAPNKLIATQKSEGDKKSRALFPYPSFGTYSGQGDMTKAESYVEVRTE